MIFGDKKIKKVIFTKKKKVIKIGDNKILVFKEVPYGSTNKQINIYIQ